MQKVYVFQKGLLLLIISFLFVNVFSQTIVNEVTHYLFPEFTKGIVLMKDGTKNVSILNYNSLTEEMIFDSKGSKLALGQLGMVDTVFISNRKFIPYKSGFLELLYHSDVDLYADHKCKVEDPGKPAAYGGTSQTSATTSYSSYLSGSQVYQLKLPEGFKTKPSIEYCLKENGEFVKILSIRQLTKLFEDKSDLIKSFVKKHNVKYDDTEAMIALVQFIARN